MQQTVFILCILFSSFFVGAQKAEQLFPVKVNGKWGYIDKLGNVVIKPQFVCAHREDFKTLNIVEDSMGYFLCDNSGAEIFPERYESFSSCNEDKTINFRKHNGMWGSLDTSGKIIVPFEYTELGCMTDGIAVAARDEKTQGYLDLNKKFHSLPQYDLVYNIYEGYIVTAKKDHTGEYLYGIYSVLEKKIICEPKFSIVKQVRYGHAIVLDTLIKGWGIIDVKTGAYTVKPERRKSISISDRSIGVYAGHIEGDTMYSVRKDEKTQLTDCNGVSLISLKGEYSIYHIWDFYNGYAAIIKNGKYGLINLEGKMMINPIYDLMGINSNGLIPVKKKNKWGYVDLSGKAVTRFIYDAAIPPYDGIMEVYTYTKSRGWSDIYSEDSDCKLGYLDINGRVIWSPSK